MKLFFAQSLFLIRSVSMEQSQICVMNTVLVKQERGDPYDFKSKFACTLEASESTRMRMEESLPKYHEGHIAEKGTIHYSITIWHKFIPMPQAMKIPAAKAAVDKEWEKLEKIPAWILRKVRVNQR